MDPKQPNEPQDDAYTIEDTGETLEDMAHELGVDENAAVPEAEEPAPASDGSPGADEWKNRYVRALADFDNFRKRTEREKTEFTKFAAAGLMRDLLPVLDNFDRALDHVEGDDDFHRGVLLIHKQLSDILERNGLKAIAESGVHFDPNIHEAVVRHEDPSVPAQTVVEVLQKGYFLNDRLLRPALVKVAVGGPERA